MPTRTGKAANLSACLQNAAKERGRQERRQEKRQEKGRAQKAPGL